MKDYFKWFAVILIVTVISSFDQPQKQVKEFHKSAKARALNDRLAQGWNTWNTSSVLSHVFLPHNFAVNLQLQDNASGKVLKEALIGREKVNPGPHAYDGSYTELTINWGKIKVNVKTAASDKNLAIVVTPEQGKESGKLIIKPEIIWGKAGKARMLSNGFYFVNETITSSTFYLIANGKPEMAESEIVCPLDGKIVLSTYKDISASEIEAIVDQAGKKLSESKKDHGADSTLYDAMQSVLAWDVIYAPSRQDVISPVSRLWSSGWGNWVLFDWDTYFASYMYSFDNKDLANANAIAITSEISKRGFIPNYGSGVGKSEDRSQPPVGSYIIWNIYKRHPEKWFLGEVFDNLLSWNRWWENNRDVDGYLCWGSDIYDVPPGMADEIGTKQAAIFESGLDNSPMYDDAPFDTTTYKLMLADVGLMSLYICDCRNLSEIAGELGKTEAKKELEKRAEKYSKKLETLWDEKTGIYLNKNLVTSEFSHRLSPTNFYALLSGVPSQQQAERMIKEHFYNPDEFWGEWIMPSIARNDKSFNNDYWKGKIWGPMNFLVYCGMKNYDLPEATKDLVEKSKALILKNWMKTHHVCENYHSVTGEESDDRFYHWGGLLAFMKLLDDEQ